MRNQIVVSFKVGKDRLYVNKNSGRKKAQMFTEFMAGFIYFSLCIPMLLKFSFLSVSYILIKN